MLHAAYTRSGFNATFFIEEIAVLEMELLAELGIKVISMRQLEKYIDPDKAWQYTV